MDPDSRLSIIILVLLLAAAAYLALAETAIATVSKTKIKVAAEHEDDRAKRLLWILDHFEDAVTTLLILNDLCHLIAAAVVTSLVTKLWGMSAVTVSTIVLTILLFFVGEMLPKSIGKKTAEKSSLACSGVVFVCMKILTPASRALSALGKTVVKHTGGEEEFSVTEEEIYDIIEDMTEEGAIDEEDGELISSAMQFGATRVGTVATPRRRISGIDITDTPEEIYQIIRREEHSRLLVYRKNVDNVLGMLQIRKYLKAYIASGKLPEVTELLDDVYYTDHKVQIDDLLRDMSRKQLYMAVIRNAQGRTLGIVTVEDIVEEIFGEIWDESDDLRAAERGEDRKQTEEVRR